MRPLQLAAPGERLSVLCLGAHSDDIEIGAGGTLLSLQERGVRLDVHWCVLSGGGEREKRGEGVGVRFLSPRRNARRSKSCRFGTAFSLSRAKRSNPGLKRFGNGSIPTLSSPIGRGDAHQDHRQVCRLTWNTFRDHCILEYEIPKWDGDMGQPNLYVPISASALKRKVDLLIVAFRQPALEAMVRRRDLSRAGEA